MSNALRSLPGITGRNWLKNSHLTLCLCLLLLMRTTRAVADDDDQVDYRHEYYQEDNNRMIINTDTVFADVGLGSHVRLTGDYVEDGITGATPTGAPPYSQWPHATYNNYYNQEYNTALQGEAGNGGNTPAEAYFPTLQAYTNYIAQSYASQLASTAKTAATADYSTLTNNPNFNRNSVETIHLHDHRRAESLSIPVTFGINTFTPQFSVSKETDYHSYGMSYNDSLLLNQKNTTLTAGWSFDNDRVRDQTEVNWQGKISNDFFLGLNQILTPKSYMTVAITYGTEHGYLSDPYRIVILQDYLQDYDNFVNGASGWFDNRPRHRDKETFYTSYTQFITPLNGSLDVGYRFFHDTSEIFAQTADLSWHQKIGRHLVLSPMFRYYFQTAANYYYVIVPDKFDVAANEYVPGPQFYSSDYRLSEMETFTYGLSLSYRIQKHFAVDLSYTRYMMQGLDGITSQTAYPSANIVSAGCRILF